MESPEVENPQQDLEPPPLAINITVGNYFSLKINCTIRCSCIMESSNENEVAHLNNIKN